MKKLILTIIILTLLCFNAEATGFSPTFLFGNSGAGITYLFDAPLDDRTIGTNSYDFDGGSSHYISVPDHADLDFGNGTTDEPFSICMWAKLSNWTSEGIAKKGQIADSINGEWYLRTNGASLQFVVIDDSSSGYHSVYSTTMELGDNKWRYICATYDGDETTNAGLSVWLNCVDISDSRATSGYTAMEDTGDDLLIGVSRQSAYYDDNMAKVGLWSEEISNADCLDAMENSYSGLAAATKTNLVSWWDLDVDTNDDHATSCGGSGCNGTAQNGVAPDGTPDAPDDPWNLTTGQTIDYTPYVDVGTVVISDNHLTGYVDITGDKMNYKGAGSWQNVGYYGTGITRALGTALFGTLNLTSTASQSLMYGWSNAQSVVYSNMKSSLYIQNASTTTVQGSGPYLAVRFAADTDYEIVMMLGGTDGNSFTDKAYITGDVKANFTRGGHYYIKGGEYTDWTHIGFSIVDNTATLYPSMIKYTSQINTLDRPRVPDEDLSSVVVPFHQSLFLGGVSELSAYTPEFGTGWTETTGDWDVNGSNILENTATGYATNTGVADQILSVQVYIPANDSGADCAWVIVRGDDYTGASEDYEGIKICDETAGNDLEYIQYVAGTPTTLAGYDKDYVGGGRYIHQITTDGNDFRQVLTGNTSSRTPATEAILYETVNNNGIAYTDMGLRDEGNAVFKFDSVEVWKRRDTTQISDVLNLY